MKHLCERFRGKDPFSSYSASHRIVFDLWVAILGSEADDGTTRAVQSFWLTVIKRPRNDGGRRWENWVEGWQCEQNLLRQHGTTHPRTSGKAKGQQNSLTSLSAKEKVKGSIESRHSTTQEDLLFCILCCSHLLVIEEWSRLSLPALARCDILMQFHVLTSTSLISVLCSVFYVGTIQYLGSRSAKKWHSLAFLPYWTWSRREVILQVAYCCISTL